MLQVLMSYLFILLGQQFVLSNAFPLLDLNTTENKILLSKSVLGIGAFACIIIIIGACVCCRRRKRGFEEFKNESVGGENQRSEYPIFRALSPDHDHNPPSSSNSPAIIVVNNQHNLSRDRLLDQDIDNNNGPLSVADLENIENNNAVDYIPNLNEINPVDNNTHYTVNRNLIQQSVPYHNQTISNTSPILSNQNRDQQNSYTTTSAVVIQQIESQPSPPISPIAQPIPVNEIECHAVNVSSLNYHNPFTNTNNVNGNLEPSWSTSTSYQTAPINKTNTDRIVNLHENVNVYQNPFYKDYPSNNEICDLDIVNEISDMNRSNSNEELPKISEKTFVTADHVEECSSMKSGSSEKSRTDVNSIEEALLALDSVLADEDTPGVDEDDIDDNDLTLNADDYHNIIKQCMLNNSANNSMEFYNSEENFLSINDKKDDLKELIKEEAVKFVDNVLNESKKIINERFLINNIEDSDKIINKTFSSENIAKFNSDDDVELIDNSLNFDMAKNENETFTTNTLRIVDNNNYENCLSPNICNDFISSTPLNFKSRDCINRDDPCEILRAKFHNIVENNSPLLNDMVAVEACFVEYNNAYDETFDIIPPPLNETYTPERDENLNKNETYDLDDNFNLDNDLPPPPEIKIDRDETNSEDMTTVTPVNTPIETNYSINGKNETIQNRFFNQNIDINQPSTSTGLSNGDGWFLHPQNNEECNETYDVEEDEENLSMTFEALRKQLAEVLPHAQGITGPPEYSDDEDSSTQNEKTFDEYRSPLNKYDELDEALALSLPPPPNEIIINYKRPLSPIMEESEEETFKTFVMNETKYLDSTSPGYMECSEVALGVAKPLMASNDTLFNLEDTFAEDPFSPHANSQTDLNKSPKIINSNETFDLEKLTNNDDKISIINEKSNLSLNFENIRKTRSFEVLDDGELCSPDQAKTFSEDINLTEQKSSDLSVTADQDATFTTVDEKTCITIGPDLNNRSVKDNERISQISEPEWDNNDDNSLIGISMDALINEDLPIPEFVFPIENEIKEIHENLLNDDEIDSNKLFNKIENVDNVIEDNNLIVEKSDIEKCKEEIEENLKEINYEEGFIENNISRSEEENKNYENSMKIIENLIYHHGINKNENIDYCNENNNSNQIISDDDKNNENSDEMNDKRDNTEENLKSDFSFNSQENIKDEGISSKEESGNETENSINDDDNENDVDEDDYNDDDDDDDDGHNDEDDEKKSYHHITNFSNNQNQDDPSSKTDNSNKNNILTETNQTFISNNSSNIIEFLNKEVEHASSQYYNGINRHIHTNNNLNIKNDDINSNDILDISTKCSFVYKLPISSVKPILVEQTDSYLINDLNEKYLENSGNNNINKFVHLDMIRPNKYQPVIGIYVGDNDDNDVVVNNSIAHHNLSGEEDPWSTYSPNEVDFISTNSEFLNSNFNMNDWESEEDDSNSIEEFMYVKVNPITDNTNYNNNETITEETEKPIINNELWTTHQDEIPLKNNIEKKIEEDDSCDDSSSDIDKEFVPSSWDSEAQPSRSALKTPDKSSSLKKRRSVTFKKQRYHSVYEYPKEILPLTSSQSEPKLHNRELYYSSDSDVLDGFMISSSARPFHGSQFTTQCNTWPTDSDFSWSQYQTYNDDQNINYQNYSESNIEWPKDFGEFFNKNSDKDSLDDDMGRPDSGVGESAELLSESVSLGDLRHTKGSLRLDIFLLPDKTTNTESVDSLSSSSGSSDKKISFSTFGKTCENNEKLNENNESDFIKNNKPSLVFISDNDIIVNDQLVKHQDDIKLNDTYTYKKSNGQSDSTDEDSGIENVLRMAK